MPTLLEDWKKNPTSGLMYTKCYPFHESDKTILLGDAAHPIIPFYGQGVNCGFEDCFILDELLTKHKGDKKKAFEEYSIVRKPNTDAISDLSHMNFIEMADKTGSHLFLIKKKIGIFLNSIIPTFKPLYSMVAFSPKIGYKQALDTHRKQESIISNVINISLIGLTGASIYLLSEYILPKDNLIHKNFEKIKNYFKKK